MRKHVVLFDLDGTVIDSGGIILASMRHATREVLGREFGDEELMQAAAPSNIVSAAVEAKEFAERLPSRVNKLIDTLAQGEITLNIQGINEKG